MPIKQICLFKPKRFCEIWGNRHADVQNASCILVIYNTETWFNPIQQRPNILTSHFTTMPKRLCRHDLGLYFYQLSVCMGFKKLSLV